MSETALTQSSVRAVIDTPNGLRCLMSGFPGLETSATGDAYLDPQSAQETMVDIAGYRIHLLVVLTEEGELPEGAFDLLRSTAKTNAVELAFIPIEDYSVPDTAFLENWDALKSRHAELIGANGAIGFACQYGAGRSGLMASWMLMAQGISADDAMAQVRSHFSEAVESEVQEAWLRERSPALSG